MTNINIEILQDLLVLSILFLIYIRFLLSEKSSTSKKILSYINNIDLIVSSKFIKENY